MSTALQPWHALDTEGADARYNIVRPSESILAPNPLMSVYANVVKFAETDCYPVDGGKMALNGVALAKIASGAGISFLNVARMDDGRDADVAEVSVLAAMKRADGSVIHATGKKRVDVRAYVQQKYGPDWKGNPDALKMYNQMRKFSSERAETGAKSRAIRQLLGMKASYTKDELRKPFVIPQVTVNMAEIVKDEFGRRLAIAQALNAGAMLFGGGNGNMVMGAPAGAPLLDAAQPDGSAVENHPALPPASPSTQPPAPEPPAGPTHEEVMLDEWTTASARERMTKLSQLWDEREHGKKSEVLDKILEQDAAYQARSIVWLSGLPVRTNGHAAPPQAPAPADPPAASGTVGGNWKPSEKQMKRMFAIAKKAGYDSEALHTLVAKLFGGITSLDDLTREQYNMICGDSERGIDCYLETHPAGAVSVDEPVGAPAPIDNLSDLPF